MFNFNIQTLIVNWAIYFVFGKIPNWMDKAEVRAFLRKNQRIVQWLVDKTNTKIVEGFAALYTAVLENEVLFDVFYETVVQIWADPAKLLDEDTKMIQPINTDNPRFLDRVRQRIQSRRAQPETPSRDDMVAATPESFIAVITVIGTISNLAAIIVRFRQYRKSKR